MRRLLLALTVVSVVVGFTSCDEPPAEPAVASASEHDPLFSRPSDEQELGRMTYLRYCAGCHGETGDGQGVAARFLMPRPRDFTQGLFKFTSTPSGSLPTDEDLLRTINYGLRGTAMPSFRLLSRAEKLALVRQIKTFSDVWEEFPPSSPVTFHSNPFDMSEDGEQDRREAIRRGEEIYHTKALCWKCHPIYASSERVAALEEKTGTTIERENPEQPVLKPDAWGEEIPPADFLTMKLKSVRNVRDLYRVLAAGVGGTAMPSWDGALDGEELWSLALYVDSLVEKGKARRRAKRYQ